MDRLMSHANHWTSCWPRDEKYRSILSEFSLPWTTLMLKWKGKSYWERRSWNRWRNNHQFSSVQSPSRVRFFVTPWIADTRPPCPSPTPGVHSNSCPPSWWCHPAISCPQRETSLVLQWLMLRTATADDAGWIPGWGTMIPHAMWHGQMIKNKNKYNN